MADLEALKRGLIRARAAILAELELEGERAGADASALVEDRIVTTGKTAEGGNLTPYSTKPVPAFLFFGKSRNRGGESAVRAKAKKKERVSYRDFRELNGLNTSPKNLQFTGTMWQGFGVIGVKVVGPGIVEIEIGGKTQYTASLLGYHSSRENTTVSKPSANELQLVANGVQERLLELVKRELNV